MNNIKILPLFFLCLATTTAKSQDKLSLNYYTGTTTMYLHSSPLNAVTEHSILWNLAYWYRDFSFANSIGVTYETKPFKVIGNTYTLVTEGNISHRSYFDGQYFNLFLLSNTTYIPRQLKDKKFRILIGIRNNLILGNIAKEKETFRQENHTWGGTMLFEFKIKDKLRLGVSPHFDFSHSALTQGNAKFQTAELMLKTSYQIR